MCGYTLRAALHPQACMLPTHTACKDHTELLSHAGRSWRLRRGQSPAATPGASSALCVSLMRGLDRLTGAITSLSVSPCRVLQEPVRGPNLLLAASTVQDGPQQAIPAAQAVWS